MDALDGNALAGWLFEHSGSEMTATHGRCRHCGTPSAIAKLRVYSRAPGVVVRCPRCGDVVMVLVRIRRATRVFAEAFELLHSAQAGSDVGLLEQRQP
jgi:ribosomal protein S27AE